MSIDKVFEVLEEIGNIDLGDNPYKKFDTNKLKNVYNAEFTILYNAIAELKAIEEAKPSEALEELEQNIKDRIILAEDRQLKLCAIIKQALLKTQELEKENAEYKEVLRIIFEKNVDIALLKECKNKSEYNIEVISHNENLIKPLEWWTRGQLTEEEFDLLKQYFEKNIQKQ